MGPTRPVGRQCYEGRDTAHDHDGYQDDQKQCCHSGTSPATTAPATTAAAPTTATTATATTTAALAATAAAATVMAVTMTVAMPATAGVIATGAPRLEPCGPVSPRRAVVLAEVPAPTRRQWPSRRSRDQDRDQHRDATADHENRQQHNEKDLHSRMVSPHLHQSLRKSSNLHSTFARHSQIAVQ